MTAPDPEAPLPPFVPRGTAAVDDFELSITPERAGWHYSSLRILRVAAGARQTFNTDSEEMLVLPLSGSCSVTCDGDTFELAGRAGVFDRITDFAYVPRDAEVEIASEGGGRFALAGSLAERRLSARYGAAENVPVEVRGSGLASRQVVNFCVPGSFEADKIIAVEVLTPAGNWSSYPPHKHDEQSENESELEEIYYFEVDDPTGSEQGIGYQRVYSSGPGKEIDVCAEVRTGDVVLVPYGYHGPSMAAPGYHLYYLNVMSGPGDRVWRFCDDPAHGWVRDTWSETEIDPRLPLTSAGGPESARRPSG